MKYIYSKSNNKFETSQFMAITEKDIEIALDNGYIEVTDDDYEKLVKHELCWQDGELVPYTKTAKEIADEKKQSKTAEINKRIAELKSYLAKTDYKAIKYAEGAITETEYADTRTQRQEWREEINLREDELATL